MSEFGLRITGLKKSYGSQIALDGLDLTVPHGSIFGLVGPNGAGKTTAFSIIAGLLNSDGGEVNLHGKGPFDPQTMKGCLSILPQDSQIPGHSRVRECLTYLARLQGMTSKMAGKSADEVLDWVDLQDRANKPVRTLSHGMLRRLTVAQAFLGAPDLVLLDEPVSGLDPKQVVKIRNLIQSRRGKQTVIVSSHILTEIEAACDNVAFIQKGRVVKQDTLEAIVRKTQIINYAIQMPVQAPGALPVHHNLQELLLKEVPDILVELSQDLKSLTLQHTNGDITPAGINQRILPILLDLGIGIDEVRMGSDLESEYLKQDA